MDQKDAELLKTMGAIIGGLVAFTVIIIIAANFISAMKSGDEGVDPMVQAATEERIAPVGKVNTGAVVAAAASAAADGKSVYTSACFACHGTGAAGAPILGNKDAWKARIGQGMATLYDHALNGFKAMPARGGNMSLDDDAVKAAVKYMVDGSK